jgi:hypothetical protein
MTRINAKPLEEWNINRRRFGRPPAGLKFGANKQDAFAPPRGPGRESILASIPSGEGNLNKKIESPSVRNERAHKNLVEMRRIELLASALRTPRSPS